MTKEQQLNRIKERLAKYYLLNFGTAVNKGSTDITDYLYGLYNNEAFRWITPSGEEKNIKAFGDNELHTTIVNLSNKRINNPNLLVVLNICLIELRTN